MNEPKAKMEFHVAAKRVDAHVDTDEQDRRLALLHENIRKYGTVFNTVAPGTQLAGTLRRA